MINARLFFDACYGFASTPFGKCCVANNDQGIFSLTFPSNEEFAINQLQRDFPNGNFYRNDNEIKKIVELIFKENECPPLSLYGTSFQKTVWEVLIKIPFGGTVSYEDVAISIGSPNAVRAVASAVARNPVAFLVPCHRVIRKNGFLGGFRWGTERKISMLTWEKNNLHSFGSPTN
jgi:AraC family transcriptional regulator of adaptative response/methylated-DNA-[protein]-cysteine methyltransferase